MSGLIQCIMLYVLLESNPVPIQSTVWSHRVYYVVCATWILQSSPTSGLTQCIMLFVLLEYYNPVQSLVSHSVLYCMCLLQQWSKWMVFNAHRRKRSSRRKKNKRKMHKINNKKKNQQLIRLAQRNSVVIGNWTLPSCHTHRLTSRRISTVISQHAFKTLLLSKTIPRLDLQTYSRNKYMMGNPATSQNAYTP